MNSNTNNQQADELMNTTTDQQKEEMNTVTTNRDEEEEEEDDDDDEVEETNAEEVKINTNSENEDAEEENDESESESESEAEAGGQEQEDFEDDEGEDESVSDKAEEDDEDEEKMGNSPFLVDQTLQKFNSTSSEEDSNSESESECKSDCRSSKPLPKPAVKRPAETSEQNDIPERQRKKRKVDNGREAMEEKKSVFSRFWSEEDETAILKGMVDYKSSNGADPYTDIGAFYEYVKSYLHVVPLRKQLTDKMGRLKKKYLKNAGKGKNPFFSKPHERKIFELSKKIWGGVDVAAAATGGISGIRGSGENILPMYPRLNESLQWVNHGLSESGRNLLKEGMNLIGSAKAEEMKEKWRNLQIREIELYLKQVDLIHQQTKLVLDEMKSGKS